MMKLEEIGTRARQAEPVLRIMETEKKNRVLKKAAENLVADAETIIAATALDMAVSYTHLDVYKRQAFGDAGSIRSCFW